MQAIHQDRVIPKIICPHHHYVHEDYDNLINCEKQQNSRNLNFIRQRKISRTRVRRNPKRLININNNNHNNNELLRRSSSSSSRSPSPIRKEPVVTGYKQYLELLQVPSNGLEFGEASGDDLSSEWDSDQSFKSLNKQDIVKTKVSVFFISGVQIYKSFFFIN